MDLGVTSDFLACLLLNSLRCFVFCGACMSQFLLKCYSKYLKETRSKVFLPFEPLPSGAASEYDGPVLLNNYQSLCLFYNPNFSFFYIFYIVYIPVIQEGCLCLFFTKNISPWKYPFSSCYANIYNKNCPKLGH